MSNLASNFIMDCGTPDEQLEIHKSRVEMATWTRKCQLPKSGRWLSCHESAQEHARAYSIEMSATCASDRQLQQQHHSYCLAVGNVGNDRVVPYLVGNKPAHSQHIAALLNALEFWLFALVTESCKQWRPVTSARNAGNEEHASRVEAAHHLQLSWLKMFASILLQVRQGQGQDQQGQARHVGRPG